MTFEEMTRLAELQIQLKNEREKNFKLLRELDRVIQGEIWAEMPSPYLPHIKIDLCISQRAIMECRTLEHLTYTVFSQVQKLIEEIIVGEAKEN